MRFSILAPFLYATSATASILPGFATNSQATLDSSTNTDLSVPGANPLMFCADPASYLLQITTVDLSPNPPIPGSTLNISASGTLTKDVEPGATVFLQVKYGLITLIKHEADLCDRLSNVDVSCPLKNGKIRLEKSASIPEQVPKGKYSVMADVKSVEGETVSCMQSEITFD